MVAFRTIERQYIVMRRAEAMACLQYNLCHSATLTACSGIELLLEFLVSNLYEELSHNSKRRANLLLRDVKDEERRNQAKTAYWGLRSWADFYKRRSILDSLHKQFDYEFDMLNEYTLKETNEIWNMCKHDPYLATPETASKTVSLLNHFLKETDIKHDVNNRQQLSVGDMSTHWLEQWEQPLAKWVAGNRDAPQTAILMYLAPLLDLVIRLIDDNRVTFAHKTPLMVAANYVFSSIDLMPENSDRREVSGLVDDGAVLVLTLYWLLRQDDFDKATLYSHWPGGDSIHSETNDLKQLIWNKQADLFPDSRSQLGYKLIWKVIERIAVDGPEALWRNYWQEQQQSEAERPQN